MTSRNQGTFSRQREDPGNEIVYLVFGSFFYAHNDDANLCVDIWTRFSVLYLDDSCVLVSLNHLISLPARICVYFQVGAGFLLAQVDGKGTKTG